MSRRRRYIAYLRGKYGRVRWIRHYRSPSERVRWGLAGFGPGIAQAMRRHQMTTPTFVERMAAMTGMPPLIDRLQGAEAALLRARDLRLPESPSPDDVQLAVSLLARLVDLLGQNAPTIITALNDGGRRADALQADQAVGHLNAAMQILTQVADRGGPPTIAK